ncbi:MAG: TlpA family protein disulfide reductase [Elusimicrobia bacterium]|nr:TlpA family protein disulfide reductase [Elusimicrobiota bacterium]
MKNAKVFILATLPVLTFIYACKKTEAAKETGQTVVAAAVETEPVSETTQTKKGPAKETKKAYVKKETHFKLPDCAGGEVDLADYGGKPVMLMFFTETCPYCRKAAPFIKKAGELYKGRGLNVIAISLDDEASSAADFARDFGLTFPVAYQGAQVSRQYRTRGVPYIFLLTKDHAIYNVWAGYDESFNEEIISGIKEAIK